MPQISSGAPLEYWRSRDWKCLPGEGATPGVFEGQDSEANHPSLRTLVFNVAFPHAFDWCNQFFSMIGNVFTQ